MREVATTLTDYLLALLSLGAFCAVRRAAFRSDSFGVLLFFGGFAAAAVLGGTWHGFFSAGDSWLQQFVWWLSLLFAGVAAAGLAVIGVELLGLRQRRYLLLGMSAFLPGYGLITWIDPRFVMSAIAAMAGTLICMVGLVYFARTVAAQPALITITGLVLAALAAAAQQCGIALHPLHFDHNATYHLLLVPALGLFYVGIRRIHAARAL